MDDAEMDPEGRWAVAEEVVEEDEPVRWWGSGWALLGVLALAVEDALPVRERAGSDAEGVGGFGV